MRNGRTNELTNLLRDKQNYNKVHQEKFTHLPLDFAINLRILRPKVSQYLSNTVYSSMVTVCT